MTSVQDEREEKELQVNERRRIGNCTNTHCTSFRKQYQNLLTKYTELKKQHDTRNAYVYQTPLPLLLRLLLPTFDHDILQILDNKEWCTKERIIQVFQAKNAADKLDSMPRLRPKTKETIKHALNNFFYIIQSESCPFLLGLISNSIDVGIAFESTEVFDPKYWECVHYIIEFVTNIDDFDEYVARYYPEKLPKAIIDDVCRAFDGDVDDIRIKYRYRSQWLFARNIIKSCFASSHISHQTNGNNDDDPFFPDLDSVALAQQELQRQSNKSAPYNDAWNGLNAIGHVPPKTARNNTMAQTRGVDLTQADREYYIPPYITATHFRQCTEVFDCKESYFDYLRGTCNMQVNDEQISSEDIVETDEGPTKFIRLDLHCMLNGDVYELFGVAVQNDMKHRSRFRWKVVDITTAFQICNRYKVMSMRRLPASSRKTTWIKMGLKNPPRNVPIHVVAITVFNPKFPVKDTVKGYQGRKVSLTGNDFKSWCVKSWNKGPMVPVIMVKGKTSRVEWVRFVKMMGYSVGISLVYFAGNKTWQIRCIHCDATRVYRQHRLVNSDNDSYNEYSYNEIAKYITCSVQITE